MQRATYSSLAMFLEHGGSASDNCGLVASSFSLVSQTASGTCPRTVTQTYSIADSCGNSSSCSRVFIVNDDTPPVMSGPAFTNVQCYSSLPAKYTTYAQWFAAGGYASDNCGLVISTFSMESQTATGTCPRTVTRTYTIKDSCNNTASCFQTFYVNDDTPPALSCPAGTTVQCFGNLPSKYTTLAQFTAAGGSASDNCGLVISTFTMASQIVSGSCPRTVTRTYSIKDSCNNKGTCSQSFTMSDNTPPTLTCPAGATVQCFGNLPSKYTTLAQFSAAGGSASDNCGLVISTFTLVSQTTSGSCPRTVTRTYSVRDSCNNTGSCSQVFIVSDITVPALSCPWGTTVQCFGSLPAAYATLAQFSAAGGSASDNCGLVISTFTMVSQVSSGSCPRTVTRTYSVADSCGNVSSCTQTFTVSDIVPPVINCAPDITVNCMRNLPPAYTSLSQFIGGGGSVSDNCGIIASSFSLAASSSSSGGYPVIITRTYSIADSCNNTSSCSQSVIINYTSYSDTIYAAVCQGSSYALPNGSQVNAAGTYYDTIRSSVNFCDSIIITILSVNPVPVCSAGSDLVICEGGNIQLSGSGSNCTVLSYQWTGPNGFSANTMSVSRNQLHQADSGNYILTASCVNNCSATDTVHVRVNQKPAPDISGSSLVCVNTVNSLYYIASSGGHHYRWAVTGGTLTGNPANDSVYVDWGSGTTGTLIVFDTNTVTNCNNSDTLSIQILPYPVADAGADQQVNDSIIHLDAAAPVAGTGYWSVISGTGGRINDPSDPNTLFRGQMNQLYVLRWTVTNNVCETYDDVHIWFTALTDYVDLGIFQSSQTGRMELRTRPNHNTGSSFMTNIQFTVKWPVSSGVTELTIPSTTVNSTYSLSKQGSAVIDNGFYYQAFAAASNVSINWLSGSEYPVLEFDYSGGCPVFEISSDTWTVNNGSEYYIELTGNDNTGSIYHNVVSPVPAVSFSGLAVSYCVDHTPALLTGNYSGGAFSGAGITDHGNGTSTFDPLTAGAGVHTILYQYSDVNGCSNDTAESVTVNAIPQVSFTGLDTFYCIDASPAIVTSNHAGGTFSGAGITDNGNGTAVFSPSASGLGLDHVIVYSYTDNIGCSAICSQRVDIINCYVELKAKVILQAAYNPLSGLMDTTISNNSLLPLSQPYNTTPWNYTGGEHIRSINTKIVDWVLVELRDTTTTTVIDRRAGLLLKTGEIRDTNMTSGLYFYHITSNARYYITILHRNHLPVMTGSMQQLPNAAFYDFSDTLSHRPYGGGAKAMIELTGAGVGKFAMIAGDVTKDGRIRYSGPSNDRSPILTKLITLTGLNQITGIYSNVYLNEDVNMNTQLRYSGTKNDPSTILQNLTKLNHSNSITGFFSTPVPNATVYNHKSSYDGPVDFLTKEDADNFMIYMKTNEEIQDGVVDNIQFTMSWPASDNIPGQLFRNSNSTFGLVQQGDIVSSNGLNYAVFATTVPTDLPSVFSAGDDLRILSIPKNGTGSLLAKSISISDDEKTYHLGGEHYVSVWGEDKTGKIVGSINGIIDGTGNNLLFSYYPNPAKDGRFTINVLSEKDRQLNVKILNIFGVCVFESKLVVNAGSTFLKEFYLSELSTGTYFIETSDKGERHNYKLIIL